MKIKARTLIKGLTAVAALGVILCALQVWVAGYLFDTRLESLLTRVERRVPQLKLDYRVGESSFFSREGVFHWELTLPEGSLTGMEKLNGETAFKLRILPLNVHGAFEPVAGAGNMQELFARFKLTPITYTGAFEVRALPPGADVAVRTSSFHLPLSLGLCYMGESSVRASATSLTDMALNFSFAGFDCTGNTLYADKPSFKARLEGLNLNLKPYIEERKPYLDAVELNFKSLEAEISTLFAIGFRPDEEVRDPTLREALSFKRVGTRLAFTDKDDRGRGLLKGDVTGDFAFAFPSVKEGAALPLYLFENLRLRGEVERINLIETLRRALSLKDSSDFPALMEGMSRPLKVSLEEFSFEHAGERLHLDAVSEVDLSHEGGLNDLKLELNFRAGRSIVEDGAEAFAYERELKRALENRILLEEGGELSSRIEVSGSAVHINGERIDNLQAGEDVVEIAP